MGPRLVERGKIAVVEFELSAHSRFNGAALG